VTDALLCADGPVRTPVELSLTAEHRRGYGSLYAALNDGCLDVNRLRRVLTGLPLPRFEGRIVLAVDVSLWPRSDAACSPERLLCHVHGHVHVHGRSKAAPQIIPGWPYCVVAALSPGRSSWTAVLDAVRLGPEDDAAAVTVGGLREVVERLVAAGQWLDRDRDILIVMDAGYDVMRLAYPAVGPAGRAGRAAALGRGPSAADLPAPGWAAAETRPGVPPREAGDLARARGGEGERHSPLRQGRGARV
jgi:hypothetical protein